MAIVLNPREKAAGYRFTPLAAAGKSEVLDIGGFPSGTLNFWTDSGTTFSLTVEIANEDADAAYTAVGSALTSQPGLVKLDQFARYVRLNLASITNGKQLYAVYQGQPQS